jgi:four helix bundle protein
MNQFDHEKLDVYHASLEFVALSSAILEKLPKGVAVINQLDRAATAIPLNIAEGSGKFTAPDRCRFFDIARGSALESAACLDVLVVKKLVTTEEIAAGKAMLVRIVSMLVGLIKSVAPNRVYEDQT